MGLDRKWRGGSFAWAPRRGTVAQTISAYDKTFSDDTYGSGTRYVSRERLLAMLDYEYDLLEKRLGSTRGAQTGFFVFADTIAARNFQGDNEQHGWLGIRFQDQPARKTSDILIHLNLLDPSAQLQQEAIGLLGVNLIYAACYQRASSWGGFLAGLFDELSIARIEVDVIELSGPSFANTDARLVCLQALRRGMTHAIVFDSSGKVTKPSNVLRKRPLIVERGRFETVEPYQPEMLRASEAELKKEGILLGREPAAVLEMTIKDAWGEAAPTDESLLLRRVEQICQLGSVVVSDFPLPYLLIDYLRRQTTEPIRMAVGVATLAQVLHDRFYGALAGGLLEGVGKPLAANVKVYAYPVPADQFRQAMAGTGDSAITGESAATLVTADDIVPAPPADHFYRYLRAADWIRPLSP
ncbi:MAG: TonB-dependent receptor [Gemmatimonadales bacterium]